MKRFIAIAAAIMMIAALGACSATTDAPVDTPVPTDAPTDAPTPIPTEAPTPTPVPTPTPLVSNTTGLPYDGDYQPVMVVIENSRAARPQTGLQTADVVYEMPIESSITRFVCVFSDNVPEGVMPVRSGRVSFLYIQQEWDALFMHFGGSGNGITSMPDYTFYGNDLFGDIKIDIDGNYDRAAKDYYIRVDGVSWVHSVMMYPALAQQLYDYSPEPLGWLFDNNVVYSGMDATQINLPMCSGDEDYVSYTYDADADVYLRFMNGKEFMAAETEQQVAVKNVIVQYSTYKSKDVYKVWNMTGGGDADIHIGGVLIKGSWEKPSATAPTVFYDADGEPIVLRPGNTWIHIHPSK